MLILYVVHHVAALLAWRVCFNTGLRVVLIAPGLVSRPLRAGEADPLRRLPEHLRKAESDMREILPHKVAVVTVGSRDTVLLLYSGVEEPRM